MTRRRPGHDLWGPGYGTEDGTLFDLDRPTARQLTIQAPVIPAMTGGVVPSARPAEHLTDGTVRIHLPRWDIAFEPKRDRRGWPKVDPKTRKVIKHRRVWNALTGNSRAGHWSARSTATREVIDQISRLAIAAGLRPCRHLTVRLVWSPGDNRNADPDNLWPLLKALSDGLARGPRVDIPGLRLVPDDNHRYMDKRAPVIERPPTQAGLWLDVTPDSQ